MIGMDIQDQETQIKLEQRIGKYMEPQNWYLFEPDILGGGEGEGVWYFFYLFPTNGLWLMEYIVYKQLLL